MKKIDNLNFLTTILLLINLFIYEIFFCNINFLVNRESYNFSMFRIIIYLFLTIIYIKFKNKFIEEARKTLKSKKKILIIYCIFAVLLLIFEIINQNNIILVVFAEISTLLFIIYITNDYVRNIIITILTLGVVSSIEIPYFHVIDERAHFTSAFNIAVGNFDFDNAVIDEKFNDIKNFITEFEFAENNFSIQSSEELTAIDENSTIYYKPTGYSKILYIPSAIGIFLARLCKGSIADIFIAGRLTNLIAYGLLMIILFKILPYKKNIFFIIFFLPTAIALAGTYTVDGIATAFIGLFIAYILKLHHENKETITFKEFCTIIGLFVLVLLVKNGAYIGTILFIFLLPIWKSIKKDKKILAVILIIFLIVIFIGLQRIIQFSVENTGDERVADTSSSEQIKYLLSNPLNIFKVYKNHMTSTFLNLSWYRNFNVYEFTSKYYIQVATLLTLFVIYTSITDNTNSFSKKEKIKIYIVCIIVYFITSFPLYIAYTKVRREFNKWIFS